MLKKYKFAATSLYGSSCIDDIEKIFLDDLTQLDMYGRRRDDSSSHQTIVCSVHVHPRLFAFPPFTVNYYSRRETPYSQLQHLSFLGIKPFPGAIISLFDTKDANIESAN